MSNLILSLVIGDWDINNMILINVVDVGVYVIMIIIKIRKWLTVGDSWCLIYWLGCVWLV